MNVKDYLTSVGLEVEKEELKHHGVKGQKWGVERSEEELTKAAAARGESAGDKLERAKQDAETLIGLNPSLKEISDANGGKNDKDSNDIAHDLYPIVTFISKVLLKDKRTPEVINLDFYVKAQRWMKSTFNIK